MLTKKHFEAIAKILEPYNKGTHRQIANYMTIDIAEYLEKQNPNFDKNRFYKASGCTFIAY